MDFEQDYLMRMIKEMVKTILYMLTGKKGAEYELPLEEQYTSSEGFYRELLDLVNDGKINEAENLLYEKIDYTNKNDVSDAIAFYGYINQLDDEFLEAHNYTREEISMGIRKVAGAIGMAGIADAFTQD